MLVDSFSDFWAVRVFVLLLTCKRVDLLFAGFVKWARGDGSYL
jgi:hypothetical protein